MNQARQERQREEVVLFGGQEKPQGNRQPPALSNCGIDGCAERHQNHGFGPAAVLSPKAQRIQEKNSGKTQTPRVGANGKQEEGRNQYSQQATESHVSEQVAWKLPEEGERRILKANLNSSVYDHAWTKECSSAGCIVGVGMASAKGIDAVAQAFAGVALECKRINVVRRHGPEQKERRSGMGHDEERENQPKPGGRALRESGLALFGAIASKAKGTRSPGSS
jgi:hypothetical protein